jgi:hypothetical protein
MNCASASVDAPANPLTRAIAAAVRRIIPPPRQNNKPLEPQQEIAEDQGTFKTILLTIE